MKPARAVVILCSVWLGVLCQSEQSDAGIVAIVNPSTAKRRYAATSFGMCKCFRSASNVVSASVKMRKMNYAKCALRKVYPVIFEPTTTYGNGRKITRAENRRRVKAWAAAHPKQAKANALKYRRSAKGRATRIKTRKA